MSSAFDADEIGMAAMQARCPMARAVKASMCLSTGLEAERRQLARGFRLTVPPDPEPVVRGLPTTATSKSVAARRVA